MNTLALPGQTMRPAAGPSAWPWWLLIATYFAACCTMHLKFSLWLVRQRQTPFGTHAFAELVPVLAIATAAVLVFHVARQLRRSPRPWLTGGFWLLWLAGAALHDAYLTFSTNEYAHYPQYALLAWLLARTLDPRRTRWCAGRVLFWTTLMGAGDEMLQYLWITASYSDYFDFNDVLVNLWSGAAGTLLYYGAAPLPPRDSPPGRRRVEPVVAAMLALGTATFLYTGLMMQSPSASVPHGGLTPLPDGSWRLYLQRGPGFYGSWQAAPRHGKYYVLQPAEGMGWTLAAGTLFFGFGLFRLDRLSSRATRQAAAKTRP